jgi:predicted permease
LLDKLEFDGDYIMIGNIVVFLVGIVCIVLGISNMKGNISSLHSYHRNKVSEEDRIPFGKQVGLGTIIIGVGIIVFSVMSSITLYTENNIFILLGTGLLIGAIIVGLVISFRAMIKYNKGIF